jgi:hypothetical protein
MILNPKKILDHKKILQSQIQKKYQKMKILQIMKLMIKTYSKKKMQIEMEVDWTQENVLRLCYCLWNTMTWLLIIQLIQSKQKPIKTQTYNLLLFTLESKPKNHCAYDSTIKHLPWIFL